MSYSVTAFLAFSISYIVLTIVYRYIVKPLNSGHLPILKDLSVIESCLLLGGNLKKIVTFGT